MTTTKRRNVVELSSIECSICTDPFTDPRTLPCGHSYCGPPKTCLKGVERRDGLRCAVCNETFNLKTSELKLLYGIRDYLEQSTSKTRNTDVLEVMCKKHDCYKILFWCRTCSEKVCQKCFDLEHQSHALKNFRTHLKEKVDPKFAKFDIRANLFLRKAIELNNQLQERDGIGNVKNLVEEHITTITNAIKKWENVRIFIRNHNEEVDLNGVETFLNQRFDFWEKKDKELTRIRTINFATLKFLTEFNVSFEKLREASYLDFEHIKPIVYFTLIFFLPCLFGFVKFMYILVLAVFHFGTSVYYKNPLTMHLLRKTGLCKEIQGREVGSIVVPHMKTAEIRIKILYNTSNRTLCLEITPMKHNTFFDVMHRIKYMGELEIRLPTLRLKENISIEGKLNSLRNNSHHWEIQLARDYETLRMSLQCSICFTDG